MNKSNEEFIICKWIDDLKNRQNKTTNDLQLCWKKLKSNFQ